MAERIKLVEFMYNMSKKGVYDIFEYVRNNKGLHYNEIQKYALKNKIVESRASVTTMLNWMVAFGLVERRVIDDVRPIRTKYNISKKGLEVLNRINSLNL